MTIGTLFRYLVGNRQAILEISRCPSAIGLGLLFVISAGLAREYDGEDLLAEPWYILIPVAASLATSFVLFVILFAAPLIHRLPRPRFLAGYRSFLGLYWMTAPLAWLYAVPYERFMSAPKAVEANMWTLALVAAWRVVLMIRVATVLMGYQMFAALFLVMCFADCVVLTALQLIPRPIVSIMGGARMTESDQVIYNITSLICFFGWLTLPLWVICTLVTLTVARPDWQQASAGAETMPHPSRPLWTFGVLSIAIWALVLPFTQPEQQLRRTVEQALYQGRLKDGLDVMLAHDLHDFPPHWNPPPRIGYANMRPSLPDIVDLIDERSESWPRAVYADKVRLVLSYRNPLFSGSDHDRYRLLLQAKRLGINMDADEWALEDLSHSMSSATGLTAEERANAKVIIDSWLENVRKRK
jgi:hypothetical protein